MLAVPIIAGIIRSRGGLAQIPLIGFWLSAYFTYNAFSVWVAARQRRHNLPPLVVYGSVATVLGFITAYWRPDLIPLGLPFIPLVAVALWCSWTRRERSLLNDVVTIAAACLFGYVVYLAGYTPDGAIDIGRYRMLGVVLACFTYFVGTALYVKTIIRERGSVVYQRASVGYHIVWTLVWAAPFITGARWPSLSGRASLAMAAFFAVLTVRASLLGGRSLRPMAVGIGELAACAVLVAIVTVVWR